METANSKEKEQLKQRTRTEPWLIARIPCISPASFSVKDYFHQYNIHLEMIPFIHSGYFYSASSSPLLLRGAPGTARILCRSFMPKHHRQEGLALCGSQSGIRTLRPKGDKSINELPHPNILVHMKNKICWKCREDDARRLEETRVLQFTYISQIFLSKSPLCLEDGNEDLN